MPSKEEILMYVQQGQVLSGWQVLRPKKSYLFRQIAIYGLLAIACLAFGGYVISDSTFAFGPIGLADIGSYQTWHLIDEAFLAILFVIFAWVTIRNLIDLASVQNQVLVLLPEGFLLKKRNTEQCVDYAGVAGASARVGRYGDVTVNIKAQGSNVVYKVQFDGRYGNARALASQIVNAQRQYAANQRARVSQ